MTVIPGTTEPPDDGFWPDVPEATYRQWKAWNWSSLRQGIPPNPMANLKWHAENPGSGVDTAAQKFGSLWHRCLLEPSRARESYAVQPMTYPVVGKAKDAPGTVKAAENGLEYEYCYGRGANRVSRPVLPVWDDEDHCWAIATNEPEGGLSVTEKTWNNNSGWCKRWAAEKEADGYDVVTARDIDAARAMCEQVHLLDDFKRIIDGAQFEVSIVWTDPQTGLRCKGRLDIWQPQFGQFGDVKKTAKSAAIEKFERDVFYYKYHCQMAMYRDGCNVLLRKMGKQPPQPGKVRLIAVEDHGAHLCGIYTIFDDRRYPSSAFLNEGREVWHSMIQQIQAANKSGYWPPHNPGPGGQTAEHELMPSDWMLGNLGEEQRM